MKVTIFGATGFSGQAILSETIRQGHEVTVLVRDASKVHIKHKNLTIVEGNVLDSTVVASVLHNQEAVIQCLGVGGKGDGKPSTLISDATTVALAVAWSITDGALREGSRWSLPTILKIMLRFLPPALANS